MKDLSQVIENKNVLYIHGLGSSANSRTAKALRAYLGDRVNFFAETWDLTNPGIYKAINKYVANNHIQVVIASSLGAFYAMSITDSVAKILINPCMKPSIEIPKLTNLSQAQIDAFAKLEDKVYDRVDAEMRICTFAGFGNKDELFNYQTLFRKTYGNDMVVVPGGHRLPDSSLYKVIEAGLAYFEQVQGYLKEELVNETFTNLFKGDDFSKWKDQAYELLQRSYAPIGGLLGVPDADALVNDSDMWKIYRKGNKILAIIIYTFKRTGRKLTACGCLQNPDPNSVTGFSADPVAKAWLYKIINDDMHRRDGWAEVDRKMERICRREGGVPIPVEVAAILMKGKNFTKVDPDGYHYWRIIGGEEHEKIIIANPDGAQIRNNTIDE